MASDTSYKERTSGKTKTMNGRQQHGSASSSSARPATFFGRKIDAREMPTLDWIHVAFLFYSAAHNFINAFHRAESIMFFFFVVVGILSVELMLWTIYKHWKGGRMVGRMLTISMYAGTIAMFYATVGILAQAQTGTDHEWLNLYYQWILPTSAPVMFIFAFLIQSVDPIMTAQRDAIAYAHLVRVEEQRDELDQKRYELNHRRDVRRLKAHIQKQKLIAMWRESGSRRTRYLLKKAMQQEVPRILRSIGVPVSEKTRKSNSIFPWFSTNGHAPPRLPGGKKKDDENASLT